MRRSVRCHLEGRATGDVDFECAFSGDDSVLAESIEELENKCNSMKEKINEIGEELEVKIKGLADLLKSCEKK